MSKDLHSDPLRVEDDLVHTSTFTSPGMVFQLADGTVCACNASAASILGYTVEQLQDRNSTDFPWQTIHADGSPFPGETHPAMVALNTGKPCQNVVMGFYKPDGELVWLLLSSQPLFNSDATTPYGVVTTFSQLVEGVEGKTVEDGIEQTRLEPIGQQEISQRQEIESRLVAANNQLERLVEARTTELSQALAALAESSALYRTLAKNFPNGAVVLFDCNLRYLLAEGQELVLTGVSNQEMVGKTIWEVFCIQTCAAVEPIYRKALAGETTITEVPYNNRIYSTYTLPVKNDQGEIFAGMAMTQNITERKRVETELQKSHQSLINTLESITDAFFTLDTEWRFTYLNHQATQLLQRERDDLIGKSPFCIQSKESIGNTFESINQTLVRFL